MRIQGKSRLGFYPLPLSEAQRIRRFLSFPDQSTFAVDPCVGDGVAFEVITSGAEVFRYGIELDAYRAEQAKQRIPKVVQGNTLEVQCPVECFGLLYLNPPYDWTLGERDYFEFTLDKGNPAQVAHVSLNLRKKLRAYWAMKGTPPADRQERLLAKLGEVEKAVLSG